MNIEWIEQQVRLPLSQETVSEAVAMAEKAGRTCYKSETKGSPCDFLSKILHRGHESVLEHITISAVLTTDRSVTHQLVRHRHCAFSMESQRYVNYNKKGTIQLIKPQFFGDPSLPFSPTTLFKGRCQTMVDSYENLIKEGLPPEEARGLLPNCTATTIAVTTNLREWRHIFRMRLDSSAQPQIRSLFRTLRKGMEDKYGLAWAFKDTPDCDFRIYIPAILQDVSSILLW